MRYKIYMLLLSDFLLLQFFGPLFVHRFESDVEARLLFELDTVGRSAVDNAPNGPDYQFGDPNGSKLRPYR